MCLYTRSIAYNVYSKVNVRSDGISLWKTGKLYYWCSWSVQCMCLIACAEPGTQSRDIASAISSAARWSHERITNSSACSGRPTVALLLDKCIYKHAGGQHIAADAPRVKQVHLASSPSCWWYWNDAASGCRCHYERSHRLHTLPIGVLEPPVADD